MKHIVKILHIISTLDTGGAENFLLRLITNINPLKFQNCVVSLTNVGPVGIKIKQHNIPVYSLNMKKGVPDIRGILPLYKIIKTFKPDIIQPWLYHANLLSIPFQIHTKCVWNIRCSNMDLKTYGFVYKWTVKLGALCSKIPDTILFNSFRGQQIHKDLKYTPNNYQIIPNGIDTQKFSPNEITRNNIRKELNIPYNAIVIGLVARFDLMKGHDNFFNAVKIIIRSYPDIHFVIIGRDITDNNKNLKRLILQIKTQINIHLLGERDDINKIYCAMDIATSSSIGEGFSNAIAEAMSCALPCVVTDVGDSAKIVGDTGIIVPPKNPDALARGWEELISIGHEKRLQLGLKARKRIQQYYNIQTCIKHYENLYEKIINS